MKTHEIRLNIEFCDDVISGKKSFEIRNNDRGYQSGDLIKFTAVDSTRMPKNHPINDKLYSIEYVLNGWGLKNGFVALAIREVGSFTYLDALFLVDKLTHEKEQVSDTHWEECRQIALYDDQLRRAEALLTRVRDVHAAAIREGCQAVSVLTGRLMNDADELLKEIERTETPSEPVLTCPSLFETVRICDYTAEPCPYPYQTCSLCNEKHGAFARMESEE